MARGFAGDAPTERCKTWAAAVGGYYDVDGGDIWRVTA